ncbi:MAG TPA: hypothetical protein VMK31_07135 [Sphingomicrobium sp.]|nr:hypothetical protein [Sphingomicrobium sp.]
MVELFASGVFGSLVTLIVVWFALPKLKAEARKLGAETDDLIVSRLLAEIDWLETLRNVDEINRRTAKEREMSVKYLTIHSAATPERYATGQGRFLAGDRRRGFAARRHQAQQCVASQHTRYRVEFGNLRNEDHHDLREPSQQPQQPRHHDEHIQRLGQRQREAAFVTRSSALKLFPGITR